ncbi:MAG: desulfoferrodoxin family protein [Candidatus Binatia bacterium]
MLHDQGKVAWTIMAVGFYLGLLLAGDVKLARAGQEEQFTPEFKELRKSTDPKHTPKITAPDSVKRGQWFDVTVSVGTGGEHPSLTEHFVRYIALYINTAEIARVYLHPVYSFPKVTFTIALDECGSLRAIEEPTHSAGWEATKKIAVTK